MKVMVDTRKCTGHARCWAVAPQVFTLDTDGYNVTLAKVVPKELEALAQRGARACPERAIMLVED